jgi:guanylate kinase
MSVEQRPRRGMMLVISSPSGAGKTSLSRQLVMNHAELSVSVSSTTRPARPGEMEGREYNFVDWATFDGMISDDLFLEWAEVHENRYGTPRKPVEKALAEGRDVLFDVDWQGARSISATGGADVVSVFILPPTIAELRRRLYARAEDDAAVIERRLSRAKGEIARWTDYDYVIVNEDFDRAYSDLAHIYHAERICRGRNSWLAPLVQNLLDEEI